MTEAHDRWQVSLAEPDPVALRAALDQLLRLWLETPSANVIQSRITEFRLVYGPIAHSMYMAEAARFLIDQARLPAAQPLARVALEHAVAAMWVHQHPDGVPGMADKILLDVTTYFRNAESILAPWVEPKTDARQGSISQQKKTVPHALLDFKQAAMDLGAEWLYIMHIQLSGSIHAGIQTLDAYYLDDPQAPAGVALLNAQIDVELLPVLHMLAISCTFSMGVYAELTHGDGLADAVAEIGRTIDVPLLLPFIVPGTETSSAPTAANDGI